MEMIQNFINWVLEQFNIDETCATYYDSQDKQAVILKIITKIPQFYDKLEEKLCCMLNRNELKDYLITCKGTANGIEYLVFLRADY